MGQKGGVLKSRVRQRVVESDMDKKILTGMIVSTNYCLDVSRIIDLNFFLTSHSKKIAKWILSYFKKYKIAPEQQIKDIFQEEEATLKKEEADLIESFLKELSDRYEEERSIENNLNIPYLFDQTIEYFKERALTIHADTVRSLVELGKIGEAEEAVVNYKKVAKTNSQWVNPFSTEVINRVFDNTDVDNLFKFPGALGNMIGYFKRSWLVGFMAPMKRGKTWWLIEIAVISVLCGYRTVFISLEMSEEEILERFYKRISALASEDGELIYPCFDCKSNQDDTCIKRERKGKGRLLLEDGSLPEYSPNINHTVCTHCRDKHIPGFIISTWAQVHKVRKLTKSTAKLYTKSMADMFGDNLRVLVFPINTANSEDIKSELDNLEYTEDFVPTTIVADYADILGTEQHGLTGRDKTNETWLMLKNLAQTKHALVATATQSSRKSIYKKNVAQDDTSEDIRKLAHVNAMFTLNQTETEEEKGIMRVGVAVHRHKKTYESKNVIVLMQQEVGQPLLDSEYYSDRKRLEQGGDSKYPKK